MGLLRLLFRLDADASGLQSKLHQTQRQLLHFSQISARNFRTAFTTFFSVSAMRQMLMRTFQFARKYATDDKFQEKVKDLGTTLDDVAIHSIMATEIALQALGYQIIEAVIPAIRGMNDVLMWFVGGLRKMAAVVGFLSVKLDPTTRKNEIQNQMGILKNAPGAEMHAWFQALKAYPEQLKELGSLQTAGELAEILDGVTKQMEEFRANVENRVAKDIAEGRAKEQTVTTPAEAAAAQMKRDSLASIGGFTSRADMELQSISKRQLRELEKISADTKNLNVGVK